MRTRRPPPIPHTPHAFVNDLPSSLRHLLLCSFVLAMTGRCWPRPVWPRPVPLPLLHAVVDFLTSPFALCPPNRRALLAKARENEAASSYPRVWMKSAVVERELGDAAQERALLEVGWATCRNTELVNCCVGGGGGGAGAGRWCVPQVNLLCHGSPTSVHVDVHERPTNSSAPRPCLYPPQEGIRRFPSFEKFYLMLGQLEQRAGNVESARTAYRCGEGRGWGAERGARTTRSPL